MKKRLDVLLTERGLAESREKAKGLIMAGETFVNGARSLKPGAQYSEDCQIELRGGKLRYVSRGGLKLERAIEFFGISPQGRICMDCGASTGGFTDCMLQNGAKRVFAVDVGYGQLAWSVRSDSRVTVMERTNARYLTPEMFPERPSFVTIDVSFISVLLILPAVNSVIERGGTVCALIKPQFEAGKDKVGKKGVVREKETHIEVAERCVSGAKELGFTVRGLTWSPITGPEGNIEFLLWLTSGRESGDCDEAIDIAATVNEAHSVHGTRTVIQNGGTDEKSRNIP